MTRTTRMTRRSRSNRTTASAPYDGEIAYTDSIVGSFVEVLRKNGLYQNSVIAIAADHGDAFSEHGEERHGMFLYDETIHVSLLLKLPTGRLGGKHFEDQVALAAVAPSLLEVTGIPAPATMQAKSLFPTIEEAKIDKTKFVETDKPSTSLIQEVRA
jgi:arylsulfatase